MDAIQAAVLRVKLAHIADWNQRRRQHAATYDQLFAGAGLTSSQASNQTSNQSGAPVRLLSRSPQAKHVFHQYVIRTQRRDDLRKFLADRKIGSEIYYPLPLHLQPVFSYLGLKAGDLPVAEQAAREVLALPMFPELTAAEIKLVVESIAEFYSLGFSPPRRRVRRENLNKIPSSFDLERSHEANDFCIERRLSHQPLLVNTSVL